MYYSSIGILAFLLLLINNYDVLKKNSQMGKIPVYKSYKNFLYSVMWYYVMDVVWEPLYALKLTRILFVETFIYFVVMALTVLFWTQYVIIYLNEKNKFSKILKYVGIIFLCSQIIVLALNCFFPIAFWFDKEDGTYVTGYARVLAMLFQLLVFFVITVYMLLIAIQISGNKKRRHLAVGLFGLSMTIFLTLQIVYPLMPFYAIGYMIGTSLLHTFVLEDEKDSHREELERLLAVERIQEVELGSTRLLAYTDPLTGVKNKVAYMEDVDGLDRRIEDGFLKKFALIVFDVNGLKNVNDTKGHDEGDRFIRAASSMICNSFKHSPVYRIGGDEFVAFLYGCDYEHRQELISKFELEIDKNRKEGKIVISSGFAEFSPEQDKSYAVVFERADKNMYERKRRLKGIL